MKLVGATDGFIQVPYLLEGIILGVLAATLAVLFLGGAYTGFALAVTKDLGTFWVGLRPRFLPWTGIILLIGMGGLLGGLGSVLSVRRFIRV
jgi:cell division transport system permease protein